MILLPFHHTLKSSRRAFALVTLLDMGSHLRTQLDGALLVDQFMTLRQAGRECKSTGWRASTFEFESFRIFAVSCYVI
jgi:hypothetical protein